MLPIVPKINNMKIRTKFIMAFLLVVFIPTILVGTLLTYRFQHAALNNALLETDNSVQRIKKLTADVLKVPGDISTALLFDIRLEEVVNKRYKTVLSTVQAYGDYMDINKYLATYSRQISNIKLYINNPTLIANWTYIQPQDHAVKTFWYNEAMKAKGSILWYYIEDETKSNQRFLSLIRRIKFTTYNTTGILVVSVDNGYLSSILEKEPFEAFIIDSENYIVATNKNDYMGKALKDTGFPAGLIEKGNGTFNQIIDGKLSKVVVEDLMPESSLNGLKIISIFSVDNIVRQSNGILIQGFVIVLISSLLAVVLIYVVAYLLSNRIMKLSKGIKKVAKGDLDTVFNISGNDEVGQLSNQFNLMLKSIKKLICEVNESNNQKNQLLLKQNELRLKMMASQINPHFLFNSLESIRLKSLINEERQTSKIISILGKLMRKKLEIYSRDVFLKNEIEMIQCYLEIEKYRYDERLTFELIITPESENVMIPALIIQPLVENAVHHGLASLDGKCHVRVLTQIFNDELHVQVIDNGEGMSEEKYEKIIRELNELDEQEGNGIGLHNVHMRLKLTYGEKYGLNIKSRLHYGTQVSFSLPVGGDNK
jgi:two-component system, sensor histidine kinase YesM